MTSLLHRGANLYRRVSQSTTVSGIEVTYSRGTVESEITAIPNLHTEKVIKDGLEIEVEINSWQVTASELLLNSEQATPRDGDMITETIDGQNLKWEVLPPDDDRKCCEYLDKSTRTIFVVHTKRVE